MPRRLTVAEVRAALDANLRARRELGLWKAIVDMMFESPNPFEPAARRKPRDGFILLCILITSTVCALLYFNAM
jgi:hypothetical protein